MPFLFSDHNMEAVPVKGKQRSERCATLRLDLYSIWILIVIVCTDYILTGLFVDIIIETRNRLCVLVFCSHVLKENKTFTRSSVTRTTKNHSEAGCLTGGLTISFIKVSHIFYGSVMLGIL